jgi:hypothetical protein
MLAATSVTRERWVPLKMISSFVRVASILAFVNSNKNNNDDNNGGGNGSGGGDNEGFESVSGSDSGSGGSDSDSDADLDFLANALSMSTKLTVRDDKRAVRRLRAFQKKNVDKIVHASNLPTSPEHTITSLKDLFGRFGKVISFNFGDQEKTTAWCEFDTVDQVRLHVISVFLLLSRRTPVELY